MEVSEEKCEEEKCVSTEASLLHRFGFKPYRHV